MRVCDLEKFCPEKKIIKLGGREFDISVIPFEITLKMYEILPIMEKLEQSQVMTKEDYDKIFVLIYETLKLSDDDLEEKWVRRHITTARFNEIVPFIFSALFDDGKKNEEAGAGVDTKISTSVESSPSSAGSTDGQQNT